MVEVGKERERLHLLVRYDIFFRGLVAKTLGLVCSGFTELQVSYISSESHSSRRY